MNITDYDIRVKYKKLFKYIDTIVYKYYNKGNNRNSFKNISYDYKDLKQEAYIVAINHLSKYRKKYKHLKTFDGAIGIKLNHHIKNMVLYRLKNILRDNLNQNLIAVEDICLKKDINDEFDSTQLESELAYLEETIKKQEGGIIPVSDRLKTKKLQAKEKENIIKRYIKLFNPLMIAEKHKEPLLTEKEIITLLKENCKTDEEFEVVKLKLIDNLSYKEIVRDLNLPSRANACGKYQRVIKRLKEKYSSVEELIY